MQSFQISKEYNHYLQTNTECQDDHRHNCHKHSPKIAYFHKQTRLFLFNDLNRTYSCIYENTKHEQLFLNHLLQNNQEKNKRVVTGVSCMLQHVCILNKLRRWRGGAGAPRRGGGAGGGGAGASGGPNQRRYSFIMNGFKKIR